MQWTTGCPRQRVVCGFNHHHSIRTCPPTPPHPHSLLLVKILSFDSFKQAAATPAWILCFVFLQRKALGRVQGQPKSETPLI